MADAPDMPLEETLRALAGTPAGESSTIALLAWAAGRWSLMDDKQRDADRLLRQALEAAPELRPPMRLLAVIHERKRDVRGLIQFIDQEIRATRHPREAAALYRERGLVVESQFGDLEAATQCFQAAVQASTEDLPSLRAMERVSLSNGDISGLETNLESQLTASSDAAASVPILHELGLLQLRRGGDPELAVALFLKALELAPGHPLVAQDLLRACELVSDGAHAVLALEHLPEQMSPSGRALAMARAAAVVREAGDKAAALPLLRAAAATHGDNLSVWASLHEHAVAAGAYETAVDASLRVARALPSDANLARAEALYRAAKIATERTSQLELGIRAYFKALREDPGHVPALEEVARLLAQESRHAQLLELLEHQAAAAVAMGLTRKEVAAAHLRVGQLLERHLSRPEAALRAYERASEFAPDFRPPRDAIERLLHLQSDTQGLLAFYEFELENCSDDARVDFLHALLGQLAARAGDPGRASKHLVALLKRQPDHMISLQSLARLMARQGRRRDVLKITEREASLTRSPQRQAKLLHRAGELHLEEGDAAAARRCFEAAIEAVDEFAPALDSLQRVLTDAGDHDALVDLLRRKLVYASDRHARAEIQLEIAGLLAFKLDRPEEALDLLEVMLHRWPDHLPGLHMASRIATQLALWRRLVKLLEAHILATRSTQTRALLLHRSARIYAEQLDDEATACRLLVRALAFWPDLGVARTELLRLYEKLGRSRELRALAESAMDTEQTSQTREALALQLAELSPRVEIAIQYLEPVAEARPEDFITQQRLARAAQFARRHEVEALARTRMSAALRTEASPDLSETHAHRYLAGAAHERCKRLDEADAVYAEILDEDPEFVLAARGRQRIKSLRQDLAAPIDESRLKSTVEESQGDFQAAALANIAAEVMERRGKYEAALEHLKAARAHAPNYLPALHTEARVLARVGDTASLIKSISIEERIAEHATHPPHQARALVRAGRLAMRRATPGEPAPEAWRLLSEAMTVDAGSDDAPAWAMRVLTTHGAEEAPSLRDALLARVDAVAARSDPDRAHVMMAGRLAEAVDGPEAAIEVFERAVAAGLPETEFASELAKHYAMTRAWERGREVLTLLLDGAPPERRAALLFYLAEMDRELGEWESAFERFMEAGAGGFHPEHAFMEAETLADANGDHERLVLALERRIDALPGWSRPSLLRRLARIHGDKLSQPERAIELLRRVVAAESGDIEALRDLHSRLLEAGNEQEAAATLMGAIAHHRALIRGERFAEEDAPDEIVGRLGLLYRLSNHADGVYIATALRETLAPTPGSLEHISTPCDTLRSTPWPLPASVPGRGLDGLISDLPHAPAVELLHEASFCVPERFIEAAPQPPGGPPLPPANGAVMVISQLSDALGVTPPRVYVDAAIKGVALGDGQTPFIRISAEVQADPAVPSHRAALGRAIFKLAIGGNWVRDVLSGRERLCYLAALIQGAEGVLPAALEGLADDPSTRAFLDGMSSSVGSLFDAARALSDSLSPDDGLTEAALDLSLDAAEDRVALVSAADPRPVLELLREGDGLSSPRARALLAFLFSDEHLRLREAWGYIPEEGGETT